MPENKPHISYSELKEWGTCPFKHKLLHIDDLKAFNGNEYTAFGTAIHTVCEKKLLQEDMSEDFFLKELEKNIAELDEVDTDLVHKMKGQGQKIIPEIDEALVDAFSYDYEVFSSEESLMEDIEGSEKKFKGFIDAVIKTSDGRYHIVDWKTCSWGWDAKKRSDPMITYQLTLYKHFWCKKHGVDPTLVDTHFALLKRTAKSNHVEIFYVTSGPRKTNNALDLLTRALSNISNKKYIKNRLACTAGYGCEFYKTEHCR